MSPDHYSSRWAVLCQTRPGGGGGGGGALTPSERGLALGEDGSTVKKWVAMEEWPGSFYYFR